MRKDEPFASSASTSRSGLLRRWQQLDERQNAIDELHEEMIKIISNEVTSALARATATLTAKLARSMSNSLTARLT